MYIYIYRERYAVKGYQCKYLIILIEVVACWMSEDQPSEGTQAEKNELIYLLDRVYVGK